MPAARELGLSLALLLACAVSVLEAALRSDWRSTLADAAAVLLLRRHARRLHYLERLRDAARSTCSSSAARSCVRTSPAAYSIKPSPKPGASQDRVVQRWRCRACFLRRAKLYLRAPVARRREPALRAARRARGRASRPDRACRLPPSTAASSRSGSRGPSSSGCKPRSCSRACASRSTAGSCAR